jgi:hypothetical protein
MQVTAVYWITHNVAQKLCGFTEEDNEDAPVRGATFIHVLSLEFDDSMLSGHAMVAMVHTLCYISCLL